MSLNPWALGWDAIASCVAAAGLAGAAFSLWQHKKSFEHDARLREIETCHRLEAEVEAAWAGLDRSKPLSNQVRSVFNRYEHCAQYLNSFPKAHGPAALGLKQAIIEVVRKATADPATMAAIRECRTSDETYTELQKLVSPSGIHLPVKPK